MYSDLLITVLSCWGVDDLEFCDNFLPCTFSQSYIHSLVRRQSAVQKLLELSSLPPKKKWKKNKKKIAVVTEKEQTKIVFSQKKMYCVSNFLRFNFNIHNLYSKKKERKKKKSVIHEKYPKKHNTTPTNTSQTDRHLPLSNV